MDRIKILSLVMKPPYGIRSAWLRMKLHQVLLTELIE